MFYAIGAFAMAAYEMAAQEEKYFAEAVAKAPPEVREKMITERKVAKEKAERYAIQERRHQELCAAIRRSGFWP